MTIAASRRRGYRVFGALAIVVTITIVAFLPVLGADFVSWDDNRNFLGNPDFRGLGLHQLRWMWTTTLMGHYIPLTWMTLGVDYVLWGMNPAGYHATNLLLHAVAAGLLFATAFKLYRAAAESDSSPVFAAAVAALAFSIHPLRVESVAWVTERRDMLSMTFYLASLLIYLRAVTPTFSRARYWLALVMFLCALLSKATAVTLPAVLLLVNVYPLRRFQTRAERATVARELLPFMALSAAAGLLSLFVLHPPAQLSVIEKIAVSAYSFAFYLWKTLLPLSLSPLYQLPRHPDLLRWPFVTGYIVCVAYGVTAAILWRTKRGVSVGMIAFIAILLPLLGIVQNGPQIAADRYTYHASVALAVLAGALTLRWRSITVRVLSLAVLAVWGVLTWSQSRVWKDSDSLWSQVLRVDANSPVALFGLGDVRIAQGRHVEALELYRRAVAIDSEYPEGHNNLGILYARQGDFESAIREHRRAVELQPRLAEGYANLGVALARTGRDSLAIAAFEQAIALRPDLPDAEVNWGNVLVRQGHPRLAVPHYQRALAADSRNAQAHLNLGVALAQLADYDAASREFEAALSLDPRLEDARTYLREARRRLGAGKPR